MREILELLLIGRRELYTCSMMTGFIAWRNSSIPSNLHDVTAYALSDRHLVHLHGECIFGLVNIGYFLILNDFVLAEKKRPTCKLKIKCALNFQCLVSFK